MRYRGFTAPDFRPERPLALVLAWVLLTALALFPAPANAYPRPGLTERIPIAPDGTEGNGHSGSSAISADGGYVAFTSTASNLVPGDTNGTWDVFVDDRQTGTMERVSIAADGAEANSFSLAPVISADGRHLAFWSAASNLVPGDTNGFFDIFVHDRVAGTTERVSVAADGAEANSQSFIQAISADGRHVAFQSEASNLVPEDTNGAWDVFVHDLVAGTTERVSVASDGAEATDGSFNPSISADGRYVAFQSPASNLIPADTNPGYDVFVHDRETGATERVSVASDGSPADSHSFGPAISGDGRYVAFTSEARRLVPADNNGTSDVFVHDRAMETTERVSVASDGAEANTSPHCIPLCPASYLPAISADGRHVVFSSDASALVPGDTNGARDLFVHDRATRTTERANVASDGAETNAHSNNSAISADGRYVAFQSDASNLVPGDTNGAQDVFVHDRGGSPGVVDRPSVVKVPGGVGVSGRATFSGATLAEGSDPVDDGTAGGPLEAAEVGAELTGAALIYRPEQEDLLLRLDLSSLPSEPNLSPVNQVGIGAGLPGVLYGADLRIGEARYEVRALRAAATSTTPWVPRMALYRCAPVCTEHAPLTGSLGTTGEEVLVSVPLTAVEAAEGTELTDLRAFTAVGEAAPGAVFALDEIALDSSVVPNSRVELGIADASTPEGEVTFTVDADVAAGDFSGTVPTAELSPGSYRVWARACLGDACGPAASSRVTLGEVVERIETILELTVAGRGSDMHLTARLTELDAPSEVISGRTIDFYSDGELIGSAETDQDGVATVAVPPGHRGANRTYEAVFAGDNLYRGSSDERPGQGGGRGGEASGTTQADRSGRGAVLPL